MDPLLDLFGEASPELFRRNELHLVHGPLTRFPAWMRSGALANLGQLCKQYQGAIEVARGPSSFGPPGLEFVGSGGQVRVSGARPEALLALGLTLYFSELAGVAPESTVFARALDTSLGVPPGSATLGLFVNAPDSGLPFHHDSHDQLFFQLSGKKSFSYVRKRLSEHPTIPFAPNSIAHPYFAAVYGHGYPSVEPPQAEVETIELVPGSAFFMPAGTLHRTIDQAEICFSLVAAVRPPSKLDLLLYALDHSLRRNPRFRAPSYGYFEADGTRSLPDGELDSLRELARDALPGLDADALRLAWLAGHHREGSLSTHAGRPYSEYVRVPSTKVRFLGEQDGRFVCAIRPVNTPEEFGLELEASARALVDHLLQMERTFAAKELCERFTEFEAAEIEDLLDKLARVGLLRPVAVF
jgi:hypothetical protein